MSLLLFVIIGISLAPLPVLLFTVTLGNTLYGILFGSTFVTEPFLIVTPKPSIVSPSEYPDPPSSTITLSTNTSPSSSLAG